MTLAIQEGTQIRFFVSGSFSPADAATNWTRGTPTDVALTLSGLADSAGRQSAKFDFGANRHSMYALFGCVDYTGETPTAGGTVDYYLLPSTSSTTANGNLAGNSGNDAAAPNGAVPSGITLQEFIDIGAVRIGSLVITDDAAVQNGFVGFVSPPARYGQLLVVNNGGRNASSSRTGSCRGRIMARIWIPPGSKLAHALREPNLVALERKGNDVTIADKYNDAAVFILPHKGKGKFNDLKGNWSGSSANLTYGTDKVGHHFGPTSLTQSGNTLRNPLPAATDRTLVAVFKLNSYNALSNTHPIDGDRDNGHRYFQLRVGSTGVAVYIVWNGINSVSSSNTIPLDTFTTLIAYVDHDNNIIGVNVNGVDSEASYTNTLVQCNEFFTCGSPRNTTADNFDGHLYLAGAWNYCWTAEQRRAVAKDPFGELTKPINQASLLFGTAAGGTTHEVSLSFGNSVFFTPTVNATYEATISLLNSLNFTADSDAIFEVATTFSNNLSTTYTGDSIFETAVALASSLATVYDSDISLETAVTFTNQLAQSQTAQAIFESSTNFGISQDVSLESQAVFEVASIFAKSLASQFTGGKVVETSLLLNIIQQTIKTVSAIFDASTVYATSQGMDHGGNALLNAIQSLNINQSVDFSSIATFDTKITLGINEATTYSGEVIGAGIIEAAVAMAILQSYSNVTGPDVWEPKLNVGLVQSIDSITIANLFATSTFSSQLALTVNGGIAIETAISYAIQNSTVYEIGISLEGSLDIGLNQTISSNTQADFLASTTFAHQAGLQSAVQAILNAGLELSSIQNMITDGSILSFEIVLPCGRTILVKIENRTTSIQSENRTTSIESGC